MEDLLLMYHSSSSARGIKVKHIENNIVSIQCFEKSKEENDDQGNAEPGGKKMKLT